MKNKRLLVTEQERKDILSMYGVLNEVAGESKEITISGQTFFDNGRWKQLSGSGIESLNTQLSNAKKFLLDNKGSVVYIKITAGESQVTNYDNDTPDQSGKGTLVQPGYLSDRRAITLKNYLIQYFTELLNSGTISQMPIFEPNQTVIGQTKYTKGVDNPEDPKYIPERFVTVDLKLQAPFLCVVGLTIEVYYDRSKLCGKPHQCDEAIFNILLNNTVIGQANLNNKVDGGNRTSGPITVTDAQARQIIGDTSKDIELKTQCISNTPNGCHSSTPRVKISKENTVLYDGCTPDIRADRGEMGIKTILVLDNCGNLKTKGTASADTSKDETTTATTTVDPSKPKEIKYYSTSSTGTLDKYKKYLVDNKKAQLNPDGTFKALVTLNFNFNNQFTRVKKDEIFKLI